MTTREEFEVWYGGRNPEHIGYAWDAWQASRAAALEEAAKECEKGYSYDPEALVIADKIRALKEN